MDNLFNYILAPIKANPELKALYLDQMLKDQEKHECAVSPDDPCGDCDFFISTYKFLKE